MNEETQENIENCYKLIKEIFKTEEEFDEFLEYIINDKEVERDVN